MKTEIFLLLVLALLWLKRNFSSRVGIGTELPFQWRRSAYRQSWDLQPLARSPSLHPKVLQNQGFAVSRLAMQERNLWQIERNLALGPRCRLGNRGEDRLSTMDYLAKEICCVLYLEQVNS